VVEYMDYGQSQGEELYGVRATGEGLGNIVGHPTMQLIDPLDLRAVMRALKTIESSQGESEDREAVRRIGLHMQMKRGMVDAMQSDSGRSFPALVSGVEDLTPEQMTMVFRWAATVKRMWGENVHVEQGKLTIGEVGVVYPKLRGEMGLVRMDQPSTRTVTAAILALQALGMTPHLQSMASSSRAKGEGPASEELTLASHDIAVVLTRSKDFETDAKRQMGEDGPTRISLGGDVHHPTQTLGEVLLFIDHFGCQDYTIEELVQRTQQNPPTIAFMGHTSRKRADKGLISFIATHLPHWRIKIIVPHEEYIPSDVQDNGQIESVVSDALTDQTTVSSLTQDCTFLYVSNAEATSGEAGVGDGKKPADYKLTATVLDQNPGLRVLHPLPASGELDDDVFMHSQSLIAPQMQNKIAIIAALVAHQQEAQKARRMTKVA
jgi:aspartate carbamoyltransferase catalytic subunit